MSAGHDGELGFRIGKLCWGFLVRLEFLVVVQLPISSAWVYLLVTVVLLGQLGLDQGFREEIFYNMWTRWTWTSRWSGICAKWVTVEPGPSPYPNLKIGCYGLDSTSLVFLSWAKGSTIWPWHTMGGSNQVGWGWTRRWEELEVINLLLIGRVGEDCNKLWICYL